MPRLSIPVIAGLAVLLSACEAPSPDISQWRHSKSSYAAEFSNDGQLLLSGSTNTAARLWDTTTNQIKYDWQNNADNSIGTQAVAFSADAKRAATVEYDKVLVWDIDSGKPLNRLAFPMRVNDIDLSPEGDFLLIALANHTAIYFDIAANQVRQIFVHDGSPINSEINQPVNTVSFSPDGKLALTGGDDFMARLWNIETGEQLHSWKHHNRVNLVKFEPQGRFVITAGDTDQTHLWAMPNGDLQASLRTSPWPKEWPLPNFPIFDYTTTAVNFSADGTLLITGHSNERVCIWRLPNGDKQQCWKVARQNELSPGIIIQAVSFRNNDNSVLAIGGDGYAQQWPWR
ncbi:WD40 repeat domain-containing protein [Methylophaga sp. OBS3]|uniref:WD40 repeat domain-containing protein n=1 Tax=Methylophaga sp. OBS3 TaxID=2991934 RepID=UPI00224D2B04|nr:hypothetical protein [Methylophaga sp. OBS3]MCX4189358.1 hypothetical protein [Methylophaga sp. OBS3]